MFGLANPVTRRRPSLTPMIDVVFLLLVFFMLAARFGQDQAIPFSIGGGAVDWQGPPRLVEVFPESMSLNGIPGTPESVVAALSSFVTSSTDTVVIRPRDGATLQRLVEVIDVLSAAGFTGLILAESR